MKYFRRFNEFKKLNFRIFFTEYTRDAKFLFQFSLLFKNRMISSRSLGFYLNLVKIIEMLKNLEHLTHFNLKISHLFY